MRDLTQLTLLAARRAEMAGVPEATFRLTVTTDFACAMALMQPIDKNTLHLELYWLVHCNVESAWPVWPTIWYTSGRGRECERHLFGLKAASGTRDHAL